MAKEQINSVRGDRAIDSNDQDKLGFREVAKRIANSLVDQATKDGLVVGVEGAWGSGKSSLLFLVRDELGKLPKDRKPTVIDFQPWLIGNRDALITSLFSEISRELDQVALEAGDATHISRIEAEKAAKALQRFLSALDHAGSAIQIAGDASGIVSIKWIGKILSKISGFWKKDTVSPQLAELKVELAKSLRKLGRRFVITIDDVDRLEPAEVIEILRLVRSVADLPNVIYLLCYDTSILAHSIANAAGVKSGQSYLEKIVQLTVMVPKPEPFQLRQWFSDDLHQIASAKDEDELSRLKRVVDYEGGRQLQTPRSVVRALDAIRFFWPSLRDAKGDLADLVWLQLIKNGNPALYRWIEEYCATAAMVSLGIFYVDDAERDQRLADLIAAVAPGYFTKVTYRHEFSEILPAFSANYSDKEATFHIYGAVREKKLDALIQKKRLASPDHYRLYFALTDPLHALNQDQLTSMWVAAEEGAERAGSVLLDLLDEPLEGSLTKADLLLERLVPSANRLLTQEQCGNLLVALSQVMDEAYRRHPFDQFWINSLWDRAQRLIPVLFLPLEAEARGAVLTAMFRGGAAIGWLTSVFRDETFAHGRYGDRRRPDSEWLFTSEELDKITTSMLDRYRTMSMNDVFRCPLPINILFAWHQGGDEQGPRQLVEDSVVSDEGFIETLEHLSSTIRSSEEGRVQVLKVENLSPFMSHENVRQRLEDLSGHKELGERAVKLGAAFDAAVDY
ncbi:MAG: P-loop NTPase fold protein [Rhodospirillales bacterium]